jgi:hypothetical protein
MGGSLEVTLADFVQMLRAAIPNQFSTGGSMADDTGKTTVVREGSAGWVAPVMALVGILALAGLWTGWKNSSDARDTRNAFNSSLETMKQSYAKDLGSLQQRLGQTEKTNTDLQDDFRVVAKRLQITQGQLNKARAEAQQIRDDDTTQLAAMDAKVKDQLDTKASTDDVKAVDGEVSGVRTDLNVTKNDLQMARSEMGTLIAKNHDDVETLRRLGERDYIEFTIAGKNTAQKVADVTIEVRATDPKRNQCNLALVVDDKRTEKRNRTINEPIFFYAHGARQPMEVVINQVEKNKVSGYLSIPKAIQQTTNSVSGN